MTILLTAAAILTLQADTGYLLEYPGIDLVYVPEYLTPLSEGVLTEETGVVAGQPNQYGISFTCHYWKMEQEINDKDLWIDEKLTSVLPPDMIGPRFHSSDPTWSEGSMLAGVPGSRSLGLMSQVSFTMTSESGQPGRGRAYGIFRNGYAVLLVMYGPSEMNPQHDLERMVGEAVLSD